MNLILTLFLSAMRSTQTPHVLSCPWSLAHICLPDLISKIIFGLFIYLEDRKRETDTEISHLVVHSENACNKQG